MSDVFQIFGRLNLSFFPPLFQVLAAPSGVQTNAPPPRPVGFTSRGLGSCRWNFSKVSSLLYLLYEITLGLMLEHCQTDSPPPRYVGLIFLGCGFVAVCCLSFFFPLKSRLATVFAAWKYLYSWLLRFWLVRGSLLLELFVPEVPEIDDDGREVCIYLKCVCIRLCELVIFRWLVEFVMCE